MPVLLHSLGVLDSVKHQRSGIPHKARVHSFEPLTPLKTFSHHQCSRISSSSIPFRGCFCIKCRGCLWSESRKSALRPWITIAHPHWARSSYVGRSAIFHLWKTRHFKWIKSRLNQCKDVDAQENFLMSYAICRVQQMSGCSNFRGEIVRCN